MSKLELHRGGCSVFVRHFRLNHAFSIKPPGYGSFGTVFMLHVRLICALNYYLN